MGYNRAVPPADDAAAVLAAMRSQRAHRSFLPEPVDEALVNAILDAARCAPSAENSQPWEIVIVRDPATRAQIGALTEALWRAGARDHAAAHLTAEHLAAVDDGATGAVAAAPVLLVVSADTSRVTAGAVEASIFPFVQNVLLAATAHGLGSALTTLPTATPALAEVLELPPAVVPMAVIPLGWPARTLGPPRRNPVAAHVHHDRYHPR